ncbi:hypothetical protein SAMN05192574_105316 [Mucilaginibacter gossypiicola]|uniref:Uncharacterized protein n=1 Tax=Mucilaginibacter gossypiicola TaxID=551995 RepID=A0A1H8LZ37_9SPHI|nr:hypothetical protein [Mucilaginibacter gossypiicola]SEO10402.1 hypothetical protein SAMN05192574_105316 [Mucilaginibacter gossypiicola]
MTNNELLGTLALVRPDMENDPAKKQGSIGVITYVDHPEELVYISFKGGEEGRYPAADLFRLKDRDKLFPNLMKNALQLDVKDFKDLYKISNLQDLGRGEDLWQALEIARDNPNIWEGGLETLDAGISKRQAVSR